MPAALTAVHLNERVYDELRTRILTRQEPAGAKLSLHALADELGVSRSPVHHALTRLVSEGLLSVRPRRGYYVTPRHRARRRRGLRRAARARAARCGARGRRGRREPPRALRRAARGDRCRDLARASGTRANAAFHEHQIDLAATRSLSRFYRELSVNLMMQVIRGGHVEGHANLVTEHRRIVETFTGGDLAGAERAIREHIETGRRIALDAIERAGGEL